MLAYVTALSTAQFPDLASKCDVPLETLAARLTGLSRVGARTAIALALGNDRRITAAWLGQIKKELIERECQGLLDFVESPFTLDNVAGLDPVKAWLREDRAARARHAGADKMLICGASAPAERFSCSAGRAAGRVRRVQELPRSVGRRDGSGLERSSRSAGARPGGRVRRQSGSGRRQTRRRRRRQRLSAVCSMLARNVGTRNRGRIIWSVRHLRPDLLEVDLSVRAPRRSTFRSSRRRRSGREALLLALPKKLNFRGRQPATVADGVTLGNELEGVLVRHCATNW